jgi:RNA polymerase sigma factor, sigma-70 family
MSDDRSDDDLLAAIGAGDRLALERLMNRHLPAVLALAQRMTGSPDDADDIAQEAFVRVWRSAHRWRRDGPARFSTWLYRVVVNLCLDRRRKAVTVPLEHAPEEADPAPGGLDTTATREGATVVAAALADLPPRQRAAVCLYYFGNVSAPEAARVMDLSASALESLLVRGRKALRKSLTERGINRTGDLL